MNVDPSDPEHAPPPLPSGVAASAVPTLAQLKAIADKYGVNVFETPTLVPATATADRAIAEAVHAAIAAGIHASPAQQKLTSNAKTAVGGAMTQGGLGQQVTNTKDTVTSALSTLTSTGTWKDVAEIVLGIGLVVSGLIILAGGHPAQIVTRAAKAAVPEA